MNRKRRVLVTALTFFVVAVLASCADAQKNKDHPIYKESLETLTERAIEELNAAADGIKAWVNKIRPADGSRGRFRWAVECNHPANFPSTAYILEGLDYVGIFDEVITEEDRKAGIEWILSTRKPNGDYHDAAIPIAGRKGSWILARYRNDRSEGAVNWLGKPYPTLEESEEKSVEWIKSQYRQLNPWGSGSRANRHMRRLLYWHQQGKISIDPLVDSLKFVYSIQDPETGLFDSKNSIQDRANGTMKIFGFTQNKLDLPIPYAQKIIDTVLDQRMLTPEYDRQGARGCGELDNWMVISETVRKIGGYRKEEIRKLAAHRIVCILRLHRKPDGGLSASADCCQTGWNGVEMAPAKPQGDALALATLTRSVSVCVRLLGIADKSVWTGQRGWDPSDRPAPEEMQRKIASLVFGPKGHQSTKKN